MTDREDFVILGAGHGGVQLAASLRECGFEGSIRLVSEEAHIPYHRPPLSKAYLKDLDLPVQMLRAPAFYEDNAIEVMKQRVAVNIDLTGRFVELADGEKLPYSKLCIATGSRPRTLDIPGVNCAGVYELRNADDADDLRKAARNHKSALVVGGGFIGLEAAATLRSLGMKVGVVEAATRLMGRAVAPEISEFVLEKLRALGIELFLDAPITEILAEDGAVAGALCGKREFSADMVLVGIGVVPNDGLAREAGLVVGNGIHVDKHLQTSHKDVFAIGDVAAYEHWQVGSQIGRIRLESVQNATDQARCLANFITGKIEPYHTVAWFWSEQADMKLQMAGLSHNSQSRISRLNPERGALSVFHFDERQQLLAIDTINAPGDHMAGRKLIAAGISPTAEQAGDPQFSLKNLL